MFEKKSKTFLKLGMLNKIFSILAVFSSLNDFSKKFEYTRRNKEVVLCLVQIDIHTYISAIYVYIYILFICLRL